MIFNLILTSNWFLVCKHLIRVLLATKLFYFLPTCSNYKVDIFQRKRMQAIIIARIEILRLIKLSKKKQTITNKYQWLMHICQEGNGRYKRLQPYYARTMPQKNIFPAVVNDNRKKVRMINKLLLLFFKR